MNLPFGICGPLEMKSDAAAFGRSPSGLFSLSPFLVTDGKSAGSGMIGMLEMLMKLKIQVGNGWICIKWGWQKEGEWTFEEPECDDWTIL